MASTGAARWNLKVFLTVLVFVPSVRPICYDQSPFYFLGPPAVENLLDDQGRIMSNKVRVKWGALHNFKCVDYFFVEYEVVTIFK